MFITLASTGLRIGELMPIRWADVRFNQSVLVVTPEKRYDISFRVVLIPVRTVDVLQWWRGLSEYTRADDLVFFGRQRNIQISKSMTGRAFHSALKKAKINVVDRNLVIHSFRHTYNTIMRKVLPEETLRELTGHKTAKMTDLYDHPTVEDKIDQLSQSLSLVNRVWI